jgi:prevent-host-death family protein
MYQTQVRASSQLRNNYAEMIKLVKEDRNPVIITNNGQADAVLINMEEYAEFEQFMHLQYVREKLAESQKSAADPNTVRISHQDVWTRLGEKHAPGGEPI